MSEPREIMDLGALYGRPGGPRYSLPSDLMPSVHPSQLHRRPAFTEVVEDVDPIGTADEVRSLTTDMLTRIAERREEILAAAWFLQRPDMVDRLFYIESPIQFASRMDVNRHTYRVVAEMDVMVGSRWEPPRISSGGRARTRVTGTKTRRPTS